MREFGKRVNRPLTALIVWVRKYIEKGFQDEECNAPSSLTVDIGTIVVRHKKYLGIHV